MKDKVLIVDDDPNVVAGLNRILANQFHVITATNAEQALAVLEEATFAVIISDYRMPQINGAQFLSLARKEADAVHILLTGYPEMPTVGQALSEGDVFRFLAKPCRPQSLLAAVEASVAEYRQKTKPNWLGHLKL